MAKLPVLSPEQAIAVVLRNQSLSDPLTRPTSVVRRLFAFHYHAEAPLAILARCPGVTVSWFRRVFGKKQSLVKVKNVKNTVQLMAKTDRNLMHLVNSSYKFTENYGLLCLFEDTVNRLFLRYLGGFGPARIADFSTWSGLSMARCSEYIHTQNSRFTRVQISGSDDTYFVLKKHRGAILDPPKLPDMNILPKHDPLFAGYKNKTRLVQPSFLRRVFKSSHTEATILHRGTAIATWNHKRTRPDIKFNVRAFSELSESQISNIEERLQAVSCYLEAGASTVNFT